MNFLLTTTTLLTLLGVTFAQENHTFLCPDDSNQNFTKTVAEGTTSTFRVVCDGNIIGEDLNRISTSSFDACVCACAEAGEACKGASWVSMTSGCILKQTVEDDDAYAPGVGTVVRV